VRWCLLVRPPEPRDVHLGNYEVLLPLATGGIAEVSIARRVPGSGTPVVVKRVHRHLVRDRGFCNLLRDEARVASLIRHPNVVSVEELVDERGELVVVLPYIEGVSLASLLVGQGDAGEHGALPPAVASRILADVLAGLDAAHNAVDPKGRPLHVIHRDVSPENVLVGVDGTSRVIDFGIARVRERVSKTNAAALQAKLPYMAPELIEQRPVDPRADVFGAAAVLHEALSGRRAFDGRSDAEGASPRVGLGLGAALDDLLAQALARAPEARTASAGALRAALVALLPPAGARGGGGPRGPPLPRVGGAAPQRPGEAPRGPDPREKEAEPVLDRPEPRGGFWQRFAQNTDGSRPRRARRGGSGGQGGCLRARTPPDSGQRQLGFGSPAPTDVQRAPPRPRNPGSYRAHGVPRAVLPRSCPLR
jgi:hypothetical protein